MAGTDRSFVMNALRPTYVQKPDETSVPECICSRPIQDVLCQACGYVFTARTRKQCVLHPRAIHLMDCGNCPRCKNTHLHEFRPSKIALNNTTPSFDKSEIYPTGHYQSPQQKSYRPQSPSDGLLKGNKFKQNISYGSIAASFMKAEEEKEDLGLSERR